MRKTKITVLASVAFMTWTIPSYAGEFVTIDIPGYDHTTLFGLNNEGQLVGSAYNQGSGSSIGFIWQNGAVTTVQFPGYANSTVEGINDKGDYVGAYSNLSIGTFNAAYEFFNGQYIALTIPGYDNANPTADVAGRDINNQGNIIGEDANQIFTIIGGTFSTPFSSGPSTYAASINNADVGLGANAGTGTLFTFAPGGPPNNFSYPTGFCSAGGFNDAGVLAASICTAGGTAEGFIYDNGVYSLFSVPGANDTFVTGIDNNNDVVGYYTLPGSSNVYGFYYGAPLGTPEPRTTLLCGVGLLLIVIRLHARLRTAG